jgi:hypothetical protein
LGDYGKKLSRRRGTEFRAIEATRQDFTLSADIGLNASPLRQELAVYDRHDVETERSRESGRMDGRFR